MRQPNWKRWEVILLVDMYYRIKTEELDVAEECQKLSTFLRKSNLEMALKSLSYRNQEGITMKYQNIRHIVEGKGLSAHSRLDVEIVDLYNKDFNRFEAEKNAIFACC